ncbi:MAG: Na+/H+ antiporter subunit D, partial [Flavobacterium sp.]
GFWPKILLFQESFKQENYILLGGLIVASFVTLFVIVRIWSEAFWKISPKPITEEIDHFAPFSLSGKIALIAPIVGLAAVSLFIGLNANSFIKLSEKAAYEMKRPEIYINNVLGSKE